MRRWHVNNGRGMATIAKAVENGARRVALPKGSQGRHRQGAFVTPGDRPPLPPCLVVTKSAVELSANGDRRRVYCRGTPKFWMR